MDLIKVLNVLSEEERIKDYASPINRRLSQKLKESSGGKL
jgi:hypothetical protein